MSAVTWKYDDGGRRVAGFKGLTGDCVTRAIAIATGMPYGDTYALVNGYCTNEYRPPRHRNGRTSHARTGVYKPTTRAILAGLGWRWTPTMAFGTGCTVHLRADELPPGRLVVSVSKHLCAVIDGVLHDVADVSRGGTRCVYGYWTNELTQEIRR